VMCCYRHSDEGLRRQLRDRLRREALSGKRHSTASSFDLLAAAYEIDRQLGNSGQETLRKATAKVWRPTLRSAEPSAGNNRTVEAKLRAMTRMGETESEHAYRALWDVCLSEDDYRVRLHAAQAIGAGGSTALTALRDEIGAPSDRVATRLSGNRSIVDATQADIRRASVQGWILPTLAASCERSDSRHVLGMLGKWVELVDQDLHVGVEACFAQGLKYEANRRRNRSAAVRKQLIGFAETLLDSSDWWYTQVAVVQTLALWSLDEDIDRSGLRGRIKAVRAEERHPYVQEAARLCVSPSAGQLREEPGKFIWIDEAGITANVGPKKARPSSGLWISEAAGWLALEDRARQLVADTLVYLNLIEGADHPEPGVEPDEWRDWRCRDREERRRDARSYGTDLPLCLGSGAGRGSLAVAGKSAEENGDQQKTCCKFGLCPYPRKGERPFRGELNETFCRAQQRLMGKRRTPVPVWQEEGSFLTRGHQGRQDLISFWEGMEERAKEPIEALDS
jgi:hypothetical protein